MPNTTSPYKTIDEERDARTDAVTGQINIFKTQLPQLLKSLKAIPDPRNPKKIKHSLALLMLYGLLMFVYQFSSRREVNRVMTHPQFKENLRMMFPELDNLPHADTLFRLLCNIDVNQIENALVGLIRRLIRRKRFHRYLIKKCYPIAIDGTQKLSTEVLWSEELLQRKKKKSKTEQTENEEAQYQYYVYVLEANLAFQNGMVIPLLSEFLEYEQGDCDNNKQDCEQRAFYRLTDRLKTYFPRLPILLLLDGLYSNGPIMAECHKKNWQFMIVLQEDSLPTVWEEFYSLLTLEPKNNFKQVWGLRHQHFKWINNIDYCFGDNGRNKIKVHVVVCDEEWEEIDKEGKIVTKYSHHAWISSRPLNRNNLHELCNLAARHRWGIETCFLVEKHQGYHYEHCFALNWQAMKGYHYLMRLAHIFNTLARFSTALAKSFRQYGVRGFIAFVRNTLTGSWLVPEIMQRKLKEHIQLRFES